MRSALLAVSVLLVAGCVSTPGAGVEDEPGPSVTFVDPIIDEHDHGAFAEHAFSTASMELLGHTTMSEDGKPFSYIGEMDTYGNHTVVQVLGRGSMPGFVVLDTSDPTDPRPVGRAEMPYSYVVDVKWSPDGKYVFAAAQAGTNRQRSDKTAADDPTDFLLTANGFTQFDMSDPTTPVAIAGGLAEPGGCHMLSVQDIGGALTVFCIAQGVVQIYQEADGGAWSQVGMITPGEQPTGVDRLVAEAVAAGPDAPFSALLSAGPHDITIQPDPMEPDRMIASVSFWDLGLHFYDVTDVRNPALLGSWTGEGAAVYEGNVHGAMLYDHEGMRIAVAGPELLGQTVPALWVLDVTDYSSPKVIGEWHPPGEHVTQGLLLTTHQFHVVGGKIYLAYNHAGIWVLSLEAILEGDYQADTARPDVLGYYLPHKEVELYDPETAAVPNTWDLNLKAGIIFASDRYTGFYAVRLTSDPLGDASLTSFA